MGERDYDATDVSLTVGGAEIDVDEIVDISYSTEGVSATEVDVELPTGPVVDTSGELDNTDPEKFR